MLRYLYSFDTNIGKKRQDNEDFSYAIINKFGDIILLMLDGIGGQKSGGYASKKVLNLIISCFKERQKKFTTYFGMEKWLKNTIKNVNKEIFSLAQLPENKGMGTTLVAVVISSNKICYTSIGDSRLYTLSDGMLYQLTEDDSYCYKLYKEGKIAKEEINSHPKRNIITKAIGSNFNIKLNVKSLKKDFSYLLLCTDGLYSKVNEDQIKEILYKKVDIKIKVKELIDMANNNGGEDNIGVLICEVK